MEVIPIVADCTVLYQVNNIECLGYNVSYVANNDVVNKLHKFNCICGTIRRTPKSTSTCTLLTLYKMMAFHGADPTQANIVVDDTVLYLSLIHI